MSIEVAYVHFHSSSYLGVQKTQTILTDTDYAVHLSSDSLFSSHILIIQAFCFV